MKYFSLAAENFEAVLFEYSDNSSSVRPSVHRIKSVILIEQFLEGIVHSGEKIEQLCSGEKYFVKEISDTGIGLLEITLEKVQRTDEAIALGKF